jgi:hypothetical protein
MKPNNYSLGELIGFIDEPNQSICKRFFYDNAPLFVTAPGSSKNHQAWRGGYWDHIAETLNLCVLLFCALEGTGRLAQLKPEEQFTLSDALTVLFIHDIEKPWRCQEVEGYLVYSPDARFEVRPDLKSKEQRQNFAAKKIAEYGFVLNANQRNALKYVEGIRDSDYSPNSRIMLPLAALCHSCDMFSARMFYDFPLAEGDAWSTGRLH